MRDFRKYEIWKEAVDIAAQLYKMENINTSDLRYNIGQQIKRAAVSIASNIAEGCSRSSEKEFKHYLENALGSSFELETQLEILNRIQSIN